jgi:hypothetical protein
MDEHRPSFSPEGGSQERAQNPAPSPGPDSADRASDAADSGQTRHTDPNPEPLDGHQQAHPVVDPRAPHPGLRHASRKTLVLGASTKPDRYAYKAAFRLIEEGHETVLLGNRKDKLFGLDVHVGMPDPDAPEGADFRGIDTVTLYLNPPRACAKAAWRSCPPAPWSCCPLACIKC